jgi:hypothetical protein
MADSSVDETPRSEAPVYLVPPIIAKALIKIQAELEPMAKSSDNEAFSSKYVPLDEVMQKAHSLLSSYKIAVIQSPVTDAQGHAALETILVHESGKSFSRTTKLAMNKVDPQAHGSAITYTRRYALMAIVGLTAKDEDDDANDATGVAVPVSKEQKEELDNMMIHLKYSPKERAAEIFKIKTSDHAKLAITNYRKLVSMKVRDDESKANASKIEVSGVEAGNDTATPLDPLSPDALMARIRKLGLRDAAAENKFINRVVGKPFMKNIKEQDDFVALERGITLIETGVHALPSEFYPPAKEPHVVEEDVA